MIASLRSPTFLKHFVGQHILNGLSVALCVMAVALGASATFGFSAGQPATLGAIAASIGDRPTPWRIKARLLLVGFGLALVSTLSVQLADNSTLSRIAAVGAIAFLAGLVTGYGRWALALSMQVLIPIIFVMGLPHTDLAGILRNEALLAGGGFAYIALALIVTGLTDAGGRRLMASECFREMSAYLLAVARFYDAKVDLPATYGATIRQQAALSEQMQSARALLLERPHDSAERLRLAATIGILLDAFDALVAAQSNLGPLRGAAAAGPLMARNAVALRSAARDLQHLSLELLSHSKPKLPPDHTLASAALGREAAVLAAQGDESDEARTAIANNAKRLLEALGHIRRLEMALCDDDAAAAAIGSVNLAAFSSRPSLALRLLMAHLTLESPVFRFAARLSLAMMAGAFVTAEFGAEQHGNWVLLTIAVVLRPSYGLTRQRRDDRVVGTLIGCVVAAGAVAYLPIWALVLVQGLALGMAHGFARLNYRLTSVGGSIMALVSLHLIDPGEAAPIAVRLADTLAGAAISHLFNYVWPRWEFAEAPRLAAGLLAQMSGFAEVALRADAPDQEYRMARKGMIEAIAALSDSAARMQGEPQATRRGLDELSSMLIAASDLAAQISAARLVLRECRGTDKFATVDADVSAARDWLIGALSGTLPENADAKIPLPSLCRAALTLIAAAADYRHTAALEA
jgi:uncharacterized membrane protein YccC